MLRLRSSLTIERVLLVLVLGSEALVFRDAAVNRAPDYDEGVYLAAVDAMRHGQELGRDIFTAQPPGFYHLLELGSYVFGNTENGVRSVIVVCALLGCLGAYLVGRMVAGVTVGVVCSLILAVAPSYATFSGRVSADLPATALLVVGLAVAYRARSRTDAWLWGGAGLLCGLALTIKLSAVAIAPSLVLLVLQARAPRWRAALAGIIGSAAPWALLIVLHHGSLGALWDGAVGYHTDARGVAGGGLTANFEQIRRSYDLRNAFTWLVLAAIPIAVVARNRLQLRTFAPLLVWTGASFALLLWQRPLHDNHLVLLAAATSLPVGVILGSAAAGFDRRNARVVVLAALGLYLAAALVQQHRQLARNQVPLSPDLVWAIGQTRTHSRPSELVVSDNQLIAYLAGRRVPGRLVDAAVLRFDARSLTNQEVEHEIAAKRIRLVVAARAFTQRPRLTQWFAAHFPHRAERGHATVFWR
jgi:4-amino-4-deoxy-L-arabinose transferase-like glycosyltransferase